MVKTTLIWAFLFVFITAQTFMASSSAIVGDQKNFFYFTPPTDPNAGSPPTVVLSPPAIVLSPPAVVYSPPTGGGGGGSYGSPPTYVTPPSSGGGYGSTPPAHGGGGTTPSHGGGSGTTPSHGGGSGTTPSHGGGHGGHGGHHHHHHNPTPTPNCGNPPSGHHNPTPAPPTSGGGGGYHYSPPSSGGGSPPVTPITPVTPTTPITPVTPTPITPVTPTTPTTPGTPYSPYDPNSPPSGGTCDFWRNHPTLIWGIFGWWGTTLGGAIGVPSVPGYGSHLSLQEALSNTRTDGLGELYRQGTASLLNSMVNTKFPFTTNQVKNRFVASLSSNKAAAAQARVFKRANEAISK